MNAVVERLARRGMLHASLVVYGVVVATAGVALWLTATTNTEVAIQSSRVSLLDQTIATSKAGAPPLVRTEAPYAQAVRDPSLFQPSNNGDDEGIYLVVPELAQLTGADSSVTVFKTFAAVMMGVVAALAPLLVYLLVGTAGLALLAPFLVLASFPWLTNRDIYFVNAWIVLVGMPLAYLVAERRVSRGLGFALLALGAIAASFSNAIRAQAGTGVAVTLALATVVGEPSWRRRLGGVALVVVSFFAISPFAMTAIRNHSRDVVDMPRSNTLTAHPVWHNAYIGLGYLPNAWGIRWLDSVAFKRAKQVDPDVQPATRRYDRLIRREYFRIVENHPFWALKLYLAKLAALVVDGVEHVAGLILLAPLALARDRLLRRRLLLLLPPLAFAVVPPLVGIPRIYDSGFLACIGLGTFLVVASLLAQRREIGATGLARVATTRGVAFGLLAALAVAFISMLTFVAIDRQPPA